MKIEIERKYGSISRICYNCVDNFNKSHKYVFVGSCTCTEECVYNVDVDHKNSYIICNYKEILRKKKLGKI